MKQLVFFFMMIVIFSCANSEASKHYDTSVLIDETYTKEVSSTNKYEDFAIQKFLNYNDLLKLKKESPELKNDIIAQLKKISKEKIIDSISDYDSIYQKGNATIISDGTQKIKLMFSSSQTQNKVKDSVFAYIKSSIIYIDDKETIANKITFSKK